MTKTLLSHCKGSRFRLVGKKVWLRPLTVDDATERYLSWLNNAQVNEYSSRSGKVFKKQDLVDFISSANNSKERLLLGIFTKDDDRHIGNLQITILDLLCGIGDIANLIGEREYWGKGVIKDADSQAAHFGFTALGLSKFTMGNIAPHRASTFKSRSLGAKLEGRLRNHAMHNEQLVDMLRFGLLEEEFYSKFSHLIGRPTWTPNNVSPLIRKTT